jgi:hypothetical protein
MHLGHFLSRKRWVVWLVAPIVFVAGCSSKPVSTRFNPAAVDMAPMPNANYQVDLRFTGVDASKFLLDASATYRVVNRSCVAIDQSAALGGLQLLPEYKIQLAVKRLDENHYEFPLSLDAILAEDYFGLGVCSWSLEAVNVHFSNGTARFVAGVMGDDVAALKPVAQQFLVSDLNVVQSPYGAVFGEAPGHYLDKMGPQFRLIIRAQPQAQQKAAN